MADYFALDARPTCPSILIPFEGELYALPINSLDVEVDFHVATAFVKVTGCWTNIASYASDCMFVLPLNGTVTSVDVTINDRVFQTCIIPTEGSERLQIECGKRAPPPTDTAPMIAENLPYDEYVNGLFRLPLSNVQSLDEIKLTVTYLNPLTYCQGFYRFILPLKFGPDLLPGRSTCDDVVSLRCRIHSFDANRKIVYNCDTHYIRPIDSKRDDVIELIATSLRFASPGRTESTTSSIQNHSTHNFDQPSTTQKASGSGSRIEAANDSICQDFGFSYRMESTAITCTLVKKQEVSLPEGIDSSSENSFLIYMTPPYAPDKHIANTNALHVPRHIIFLLDRSESMSGEPWTEATRALRVALEQLHVYDLFNIVIFDHLQEYLSSDLIAATLENIDRATMWVNGLSPAAGGTDLHTPLEWCFAQFSSHDNNASSDASSTLPSDPLNSSNHATRAQQRLPVIVLITDGCVGNERDICKYAHTAVGEARILTIGIGCYCNWFFLKMLAQIGRGFSDVVLFKNQIFAQVVAMVSRVSRCVLSNIKLRVSQCDTIELYPYPIPDLFDEAPLTLAGKYSGRFPNFVVLSGTAPDGTVQTMRVNVQTSSEAPVDLVVLKQRFDLLASKAWLHESRAVEAEVVDLSCQHSMPSPYTTMVGYETRQELLQKEGLSSAPFDYHPQSHNKRKRMDMRTIGKLVVGGNAVLIGAAAFSFGDLQASISNVAVTASLGDGADMSTDGCCGDCCGGGCGECISESCAAL